tara:strand:- start:19 stop:513 length:495 start_codon:yes stop_codon:yes gene_type:complete
MPRKPIDYKRSVIYTIKTGDSLYVGSTTDFTKRKSAHKSNIYNEKRKEYNLKLYKIIREKKYEWDIKPYKEFPCENKIQLTIEEERIRGELNADLNMRSCGTGLSLKEYRKQYRDENKDKKKQYDIKNKDYLKEQRKKRYLENKDYLNEQRRKRYLENKNKNKE